MATKTQAGTKTAAKTNTKSKTGKMENSEFHEFFVDELKDIAGRGF